MQYLQITVNSQYISSYNDPAETDPFGPLQRQEETPPEGSEDGDHASVPEIIIIISFLFLYKCVRNMILFGHFAIL